jgi:flagellar basal-body rod modification protein FlgD
MGIEALGKEAFLHLLTKQLQFQDPLEPMESSAFVAQLAQFRELESAVDANLKLDSLLKATTAMNNLNASSLIGRKVEVAGGKLAHQLGTTEKIAYELEADTSEVVINVLNAEGRPVRTLNLGFQIKGSHQIAWDGKDNSGNTVPAGAYTYVGSALGKDGELSPIQTASEGEVSGVIYGKNGPMVSVNGVSVPLDAIVKVLK